MKKAPKTTQVIINVPTWVVDDLGKSGLKKFIKIIFRDGPALTASITMFKRSLEVK